MYRFIVLEMEVDNMTQTYNIYGNLVGVLSDKEKERSSFEFISDEGVRYRGVLSPNLLARVGDKFWFKTPANNVEATIEETIEINPYTKEDKVYYKLVNISGINVDE